MMYVRAATVQIRPGKMQEVINLHNDSLIPAAKAQKRWRGSYLMTDGGSAKILSITIWESEDTRPLHRTFSLMSTDLSSGI